MPMTNSATQHQAFQGFPKADAPFVDLSTGRLTDTWLRLMITLWQKSGSGRSTLQGSNYVNNEDGAVTIYQSLTGIDLGEIPVPGSKAADQISLKALLLQTPQDPVNLDQAVLQSLMLGREIPP